MPYVEITSFNVHPPEGADHLEAGHCATIWAQITNQHMEQLTVHSNFDMGAAGGGSTEVPLGPGESQWIHWTSQPLTSGGYESSLVIGGELENSSEQFDQTGMSFEVHEPEEVVPAAEVSLVLQPHTNMDHDEGTALADEAIAASAQVRNTGNTRATMMLTIWSSAGHQQNIEVTLDPGADEWHTLEIPALGVGSFEVHAAATWTGADANHELARATRQLVTKELAKDWIEGSVQIVISGYDGHPLRGYRVFTKFTGFDKEVAFGGEFVEASESDNGLVTLTGIKIPKRGTIHVMAVSEGEPKPMLEGQLLYPRLADGDTTPGFHAQQDVNHVTIQARNQAEFSEKLSMEVEAGLEIEILSIGGSEATEHARSRTYSEAVAWQVRVGRSNLKITSR